MSPEAGLPELMERLLQHLSPERLTYLVGNGQSLLGLLEPGLQKELLAVLRPYHEEAAWVIPRMVRERVCEARPDLGPILEGPSGRAWLDREVKAIRTAILEAI